MISICQTCYTRYVPPPMATKRYETDCPECRDKVQHTAIDTDLIADLIDELWED